MDNATCRLRLVFGETISPIVRRRISYAFNLFCAIYGYEAASDQNASDAIVVTYAREQRGGLWAPARYDARAKMEPAPQPSWVTLQPAAEYSELGMQQTPCFHSAPDHVDWLSEIFEWVSSADEQAVRERDEVGRIPYTQSLHGRFGLDPTIPYAGVAMFELNRQLQRAHPALYKRPRRPWRGDAEFLVVPSHDLDYLPVNVVDTSKRLLKNVAIAALHFREPALAFSIAGATVRGIFVGKSPLDCLDAMVIKEHELAIESTATVIPRRLHPRDANYDLSDPAVEKALKRLADAGIEIALHGSYTSLVRGDLEQEVELLEKRGYPVQGVRQHWLRFSGDVLFETIRRIGLRYDSTVGFSDHVGFRAGACFPYPPYDFNREQAYPFVEIPLVLMDVALHLHARDSGQSARSLCERTLRMAQTFAWGGVGVLWHNTVFGDAQIPRGLGGLYWVLKKPAHRWIAGRKLADLAEPIFASNAGFNPNPR